MRRAALAAVLILGVLEFVLLAGSWKRTDTSRSESHDDRFQKGIVFGLFARHEEGFIQRNLDEIRQLGADAISIVLPWVTPNVRSTEIRPRGDMTPSDQALRETVREAHRRGLRVLLLPLVYVDSMGAGEWRGTLAPSDWHGWFLAYRRMILHYARLAENERAEYLSIGSELCSTEGRRDEWERILTEVRRIYSGKLTYSANWDHRESLSFAGGLDMIGMNAYFELSRDPEAGVAELKRSWSGIVEEVERWRARIGKPLVLTEVGYPSREGAASNPWAYDAPGEADPSAQARCYQAFIEAWTGDPALAGVYFYIWWGEGGPADTGYTPRGKPAERLIAAWFTKDLAGGSR
jgi:hypothetical protein